MKCSPGKLHWWSGSEYGKMVHVRCGQWWTVSSCVSPKRHRYRLVQNHYRFLRSFWFSECFEVKIIIQNEALLREMKIINSHNISIAHLKTQQISIHVIRFKVFSCYIYSSRSTFNANALFTYFIYSRETISIILLI